MSIVASIVPKTVFEMYIVATYFPVFPVMPLPELREHRSLSMQVHHMLAMAHLQSCMPQKVLTKEGEGYYG